MAAIRRKDMKFQQAVLRPHCPAVSAIAILSSYCAGQPPTKPAAAFPPLEQWKAAVISGNVTTLQALYSSNPPAQVATGSGHVQRYRRRSVSGPVSRRGA